MFVLWFWSPAKVWYSGFGTDSPILNGPQASETSPAMACQLRKHHFLAIQSQIALLLKKKKQDRATEGAVAWRILLLYYSIQPVCFGLKDRRTVIYKDKNIIEAYK